MVRSYPDRRRAMRHAAMGHFLTHAPCKRPAYSIASSAAANSVAGIVRPSALAVLRLRANRLVIMMRAAVRSIRRKLASTDNGNRQVVDILNAVTDRHFTSVISPMRTSVDGNRLLQFGVWLTRLPFCSRPELTRCHACPRKPSCGSDRHQGFLVQSRAVL